MTTKKTPGGLIDFPEQGRLLGLDYGTRRIGLALSNPEQTIASPLENYTRRDKLQDERHLRKVVEDYRVVGVVVGLPVHMSGDEGQKAREARTFGEWAAATVRLPIRFYDERFTTSLDEDYLLGADLTRKQRQARRDMLAAQILLQSYLDSQRREEPPGSMDAS
jgi:putative holliday junction resolvase